MQILHWRVLHRIAPHTLVTKSIVIGLLLGLIVLAQPVRAQEKGFDGIVEHLEKNYGAQRTKIPLLGVANFFVKIIRPAGVKSFKLAVFEEFHNSPFAAANRFDSDMHKLMPKDWKPFMRVSSKGGNREQVMMYVKPSGKDLELMMVVLEPSEAVVMQVKLNPEAVNKFMNNPQIMGISLAGSIRGNTTVDPLGGVVNTARRQTWGRGDDHNSDIGRRIDTNNADGYTLGGNTAGASKADANAPPERPKLVAEDGSEKTAPSEGPPVESKSPAEKPAAATVAASTDSKSADSAGTIRIDTQLVNLNVKAVDKHGQPLLTLTKEDFVIYEDGVRQEVTHFEPVNAPINLVLVLDLSGSTRQRREVMVNAAKNFIDSLNPKDHVAVTVFTRQYYVVSEFDSDRTAIKKKLDKLLNVEGGTAFYDAMWTTLDLLSRNEASRKAIVVLTDGVDEQLLDSGGSDRSFAEVVDRLNEEDVTVYPIHLNPTLSNILEQLDDPNISDKAKERLRQRRLPPHAKALEQLERLASDSNGVLFKANQESDLDGVYQKVAEELRLRYSLAYSPENSSRDGSFRKIKVEVKQEKGVARTRRGYFAR